MPIDSKYIGIRQLLLRVRAWRGYAMHPNRVHELIATKGLPAYRDELRRTPRYLFLWPEVLVWLEAHQPRAMNSSQHLREGGR